MARITSVDVTNGVPTLGTGTVATLDGVLDATNGPITTKAASTAPVTATDKAMVTVLRPDSPGIITTGTQASPSASYLSTVAAGDIAHNSVDSGNPQKQGGRAVAGMSGITLVAAAARTDSLHGIDGAQYVRPHCGLEDIVSGVAAITDGSSTSVIASAGAGVKNYITTAIISNTSATAVTVDLRDGAAGTVKATLPVPANTSGVVCNLPIPLPFSAATAVCADPSAAASTVTVTLIGFKSKV